MPHSRKFSVISEFTRIETIARGMGVDVRHHLNREYGDGRWRKLKGRAWVQYESGRTALAEIHWFEAVRREVVGQFTGKSSSGRELSH